MNVHNPGLGPFKFNPTYAVNSSDTPANLATDKTKVTIASTGFFAGKEMEASYALIQPLNATAANGIKWTLGGVDPVAGAGLLGHFCAANSSFELWGPDAIRSFRFVSAVSGQAAAVQVTLGFTRKKSS